MNQGGTRGSNAARANGERNIQPMTRLIAWTVVAAVAELVGVLAVVHTLLRYAMTARGLPVWRLGDTLLTSPLLWLGATLAAVALNWLVAGAALRAGQANEPGGSPAVALGLALLGATMAWFGLRAVGKLY